MGEVSRRIYQVVKKIPKGKLATYGQIAREVGTSPRVVGNALHHNPDPKSIPCHRVVNKKGRLATSFGLGGIGEQRKRLKLEGIEFVSQTQVDLEKHLCGS